MVSKKRSDLFLNNTKFGFIRTIIQYIIVFLIKTIFIRVLGIEYLGLNGLFSNVIGCLNVAELGIGTAIIYSMYKPIANNDYPKVAALYKLYKKAYAIIGIIVLFAGLAVIPFMNLIIKSDIPADVNIYIVYLITLFNTVYGYFWAHNRSLLFACQRSDLETKVTIFTMLISSMLQIFALAFTKNYYFYIIVSPICSVIENIIVSKIVKKIFPEVLTQSCEIDIETKSEIKKNIYSSALSQVGGTLVCSTDNILISALLGLSILGIYSNYAIIILAITSVISIITSNARSSVGNLIALETKEYVYEKYKIFNFLIFWISGFCAICLLCLINPFIMLWLKKQNYIFDMSIVIVLIINFFISTANSLTATFKISAGLMWYDRWKTIVQGIINIVFSILFTKLFGLIGIFIGTLICYIVPIIIEPLILYKYYFKVNIIHYWISYIIYFAEMVICAIATYFLCDLCSNTGITWFIVKIIICIVVPNLLFSLFNCKSQNLKESFVFINKLTNKLFGNVKK